MLDDDLRTQLAELVRPVAGWPVSDIQAVRRRARRRRIRRAGAAAAVGAAAAAGAIAIAATLQVLPGTGRPAASGPASPSASPTGHTPWFLAGPLPAADAGPAVAPYVVTVAGQVSPAPAIVLNAFTGRELALVNSPVPGNGFEGVAAAGDDRTFVLAADDSGSASVQLYELRLKPDGSQELLRRLLTLPASSVPPFAISPDGSRLAYSTADGIETVSLGTGASRSWTPGGTSATGYASDLSWAGDQILAFDWQPGTATSRQAGVRLLDTSAPGSDLLASRRIIPVPDRTGFGNFSELSSVLITPDGSRVFGTVGFGYPDNPVAEVVEFSARTGQALAVVTPRAGESGMGSSCMALWTDPSGDRLTAECGELHAAGTIDHGYFTEAGLHLPDYNFSVPRQAFIAW
jgi:hypothetical protein